MIKEYESFTVSFPRFNCGRWFAKAEDDGSIERFLVGERIQRELKGSQIISALGKLIQIVMFV